MVVVVDEYGGTSGIVTDKDIYEELFGTVRDEIDNVADNMILQLSPDTYHVDGKTTIYDFERFFNVELNEPENSDTVTLSGYILENYDHVREGDQITLNGLEITIMDYENSYIDWLKVKKLGPARPKDEDN